MGGFFRRFTGGGRRQKNMTVAPPPPNHIDVVALLADVLKAGDIHVARNADSLVLNSGLELVPSWLETRTNDPAAVGTSTQIQARHPTRFPQGLLEYQHAQSTNALEALRSGFEQWRGIDLPVLMDALQVTSTECLSMQMDFPMPDGTPARHRRILMGPVSHLVANADNVSADEDEHPFCPCCLFMQNFDAFQAAVNSDGVSAIRLFVARDGTGQISADCRINGEDYLAGVDALRAYARSWPERGFEFRKQYVLIQPVPAD